MSDTAGALREVTAPAAVRPQGDQGDAFAEIVNGRFSCRAYLSRPVPRETIEAILRLAQRTPSWSNCQPWRLVITSGAETDQFRQALYAHAAASGEAGSDFPFPREYLEHQLARRRECGFRLYNALGIQRGDKARYAAQTLENFRFFGAPHVAIVTTDEPIGTYGAVDCGAYVATFTYAAHALGVASIPQAAIARYAGFIRDHFGLDPVRRIVCGISFGYADADHPANAFRTNRAPLDEVVEWVG